MKHKILHVLALLLFQQFFQIQLFAQSTPIKTQDFVIVTEEKGTKIGSRLTWKLTSEQTGGSMSVVVLHKR